MYLDDYYSLYQWHDDLAQDFVVEEVLAFEELHLFLAVVLEEVCLTVDELVLRAEESPDELLFFGRDTLEALLFHLLEGLYHLFVNLELRCAVLPLIAELTLAQATESQQPSHVEGGIDQYPGHAFELFGVEGTHAGGNDEVGFDEKPSQESRNGETDVVQRPFKEPFVGNDIGPDANNAYSIHLLFLPNAVSVAFVDLALRKIRRTSDNGHLMTSLDPFTAMVKSAGRWGIDLGGEIVGKE